MRLSIAVCGVRRIGKSGAWRVRRLGEINVQFHPVLAVRKRVWAAGKKPCDRSCVSDMDMEETG